MSMAVFAFEALIGLLLIGAAVMCWRVDRRLKALRDGQDGLKTTIADLNDAVDRARASLAHLDRSAKDTGVELEERVRKARELADELRLLEGGADARAERMARSRAPQRERPSEERSAGQSRPARALDPLKTLR